MAFVRIPGDKARRYRDTETGAIISRRQYDKRFGRLAGETLSQDALAKKTKEENPELSASRPARGRKKTDEEKALTESLAKQRDKNRRYFARELKASTKEFETKRRGKKKSGFLSLRDTESFDEKGRLLDTSFMLAALYAAKQQGFRIFSLETIIQTEDGRIIRKTSSYIANPYPFKPKDEESVINTIQNILTDLIQEYGTSEVLEINMRFLS